MPTPQAHYSYAELEGLWIQAGGPTRLAPLMAAIAEAESQGYSHAYNKSGASGLWQILGAPTGWTGSTNWFDPYVNARAAVAKWKSGGLGQWATYTSGAYKKYFRKGVPPAGSVSGSAGIPYQNPFRNISGYSFGRVDMGVDIAGSGPVYALGPGRITNLYNAGWPGGSFISERLSAGPLRGRYVYVAENIAPSVKIGQQVTSATVIGRMSGGGIETGFAAAPGTGNALAASQFSGSNVTAYGAAYGKLLTELGAKGISPTSGGTGSTGPGWPPPWLVGILSGVDKFFGGTGAAGAGVAGSLGGIGTAIQGIVNWLNLLTTAVDWLINPANWVRIIAGVGGGILVIGGVVTLSHTGEGMRGPLTSRPAALPVGILMVGSGGVLLFVAFHNLAGNPANIGELLGSLRDTAQAASAGQPATAGVTG